MSAKNLVNFLSFPCKNYIYLNFHEILAFFEAGGNCSEATALLLCPPASNFQAKTPAALQRHTPVAHWAKTGKKAHAFLSARVIVFN